MFEIKGEKNTALCFASVAEEDAVAQIKRICDFEFAQDSQIRIMPDMHFGKGCTIGTTMTVIDKVVPNMVGVDIGCGMFTVRLNESDLNLRILDETAHRIPSGTGTWNRSMEDFDLTRFRCYPSLKNPERLQNSLGTLGGGNHFIEIDVSDDGVHYLIVHSGSRNLGTQVAGYYQHLAVELIMGKEKSEKREEIIRTYKEDGRYTEIQSALKAMDREIKSAKPPVPADLCWLSGEPLSDYLHDVELCQRFAKQNREFIARYILRENGLTEASSFHTIHNYIDTHDMILRKGAISAKEGERILIPINMRDGSILARGKGNPDWNYSAPHGAGRVMSRSQARKELKLEDYEESMKGIYSTSVKKSTLDEAPMAYKSLNAILADIKASVEIEEILKPIYNFKA